jgi:acyl carrier protein
MHCRIKSVIAQAFDRPEASIGDSADPQTIEEWDSVGHITLVSELEREFAVRLTTDEILGIRSSADVEKLLTARGLLKPQADAR